MSEAASIQGPVASSRLVSRRRLRACHECDLVVSLPPLRSGEKAECPRCAHVTVRRPHSLQTTWALLVAAAIFYVPANIYPIMNTVSFGKTQENAIIGGIGELWRHGSWPIALIIFIASVVVPVAKLLVLGCNNNFNKAHN